MAAEANQATVGNLVTTLMNSARNAGVSDTDNTVYDLTAKHLAIRRSLDHFIRETRCTRQADTAQILSTSPLVDFSKIPGFDYQRIQWMQVNGQYTIQKVNAARVQDERMKCPITGCPKTVIGFLDTVTGLLRENPDKAYTLNVYWSPPCTAFTIGDSTPATANIVVNVTGDMAHEVVATAGVVALQQGHIENLPITNPLAARYMEYIQDRRGEQGYETSGEMRVTRRQRLEDMRRRGLPTWRT